jgi:hypothetical protein
MTKQKFGLILFWVAVLWAILMGVFASISVATTFRGATMEDVNQTMWAVTGPWFMLWGLGTPVGIILAGIGMLLYAGRRVSIALIYGIGIILVAYLAMMAISLGHIPPLFGIGGTVILLSFTGILWLWAKERKALGDAPTIGSDLKLIGYVFMAVAAWFTCGMASVPFLKLYEGETPSSPIHVLINLALGWLFLFLGHYKSRKQ